MKNFQKHNPLNITLRRGETVLWEGVPHPGIRFHFGVIKLEFWGSISSGFWLLIISIVIYIGFINREYFCLTIYLILFTLFQTTVLFLVDPIRRQKTSYLITNRRIIIKSGFISYSVRQVELNSIKHMIRQFHRDGTGTIIFDEVSSLIRSSFPPYHLSPVFEFIDEPDKVYAIIENAREELLQSM